MTTAQPIRVLLVDDHEEVRVMLRTALRLHGGFEVVGEAEDGVGAVRLVGSTDPDIVLLDLGLPDLDGREVLTRIRAVRPASRIVIFSGADREDRAWYQDRSDGYVLKDAELTVLVGVLESVAAPLSATGGIHLPCDLASVADARRFVRDALVSSLAHDLTDEAFLVVSELAANAITHAESDYRVSVLVSPATVRISVRDSGPGTPEPRASGPGAISGRGLLIVAAVATSWGIDSSHAGFKTVWADLAR